MLVANLQHIAQTEGVLLKWSTYHQSRPCNANSCRPTVDSDTKVSYSHRGSESVQLPNFLFVTAAWLFVRSLMQVCVSQISWFHWETSGFLPWTLASWLPNIGRGRGASASSWVSFQWLRKKAVHTLKIITTTPKPSESNQIFSLLQSLLLKTRFTISFLAQPHSYIEISMHQLLFYLKKHLIIVHAF